MTIQLPVLVWTVVCFVGVMLILHHLLFKPVLRVMDARRERIEKAAGKKAEYEKLAMESAAQWKEQQTAFLAAEQKRQREEAEAVRESGKKAIESAREEKLRARDDFSIETEAEHARILEALEVHADAIAAVLAESIIEE